MAILVVVRDKRQSPFKPPHGLNFVLSLVRFYPQAQLLSIHHCQRHKCQALGHAFWRQKAHSLVRQADPASRSMQSCG